MSHARRKPKNKMNTENTDKGQIQTEADSQGHCALGDGSPIVDSCVKSADRYGDLDVIPASVGRRLEARADYEYKKQKQLSQELEILERNVTLCARYALGIRVEDGHEYFEGVRQTTYDVLEMARRHKQAMTLLRSIVAQYEAAPDGPLGAGFTNEPFLAAKDFLENTPDHPRRDT